MRRAQSGLSPIELQSRPAGGLGSSRSSNAPRPAFQPTLSVRSPVSPESFVQVSYALSLRGVSKAWPSKEGGDPQSVLRGIDLDIARGQFVALLGPSGCGKSTLLRLIAGLDHPDAGHILIDGRSANGLAPSERQLSMVFQSYALFPHLSVEENVAFGLRVRRVPRDERRERVAVALRATGLLGYEKRKPAALSGGQRQRVNIARALCDVPRLIVADEIVSGLDVSVQAQIMELLLSLRASHNVALLLISHDLAVVRYLCSRVLVLQRGVVVEQGRTEDVLRNPQHPYTRTLLASAPHVERPGETVIAPTPSFA